MVWKTELVCLDLQCLNFPYSVLLYPEPKPDLSYKGAAPTALMSLARAALVDTHVPERDMAR